MAKMMRRRGKIKKGEKKQEKKTTAPELVEDDAMRAHEYRSGTYKR